MDYSRILARIIGAIVSVFQATTLRDRYYLLAQRHELYTVAIEDIERINANSTTPNVLIAGICANLRKNQDE
jgi:hypothetical protein